MRPFLVAIVVGVLLVISGCYRDGVYRTDQVTRSMEEHPTYTRREIEACVGDLGSGLTSTGVMSTARPATRSELEPTKPTLSRDLGAGAGGEKLGNPFRSDSDEPPRNASGEGYPQRREPGFIGVRERGGDASTFGLDVDTASYSNVRRFLQSGTLPPVDAVRVEELLNYFPYHYQPPAADAEIPLALRTDLIACPWQGDHHLLRVAVKARETDAARRPSLNLIFLIDTSGSMDARDRLPLVVDLLKSLTTRLDADDIVGIVTYAGESRVALEPVAGDQRERITTVLNRLRASGSTNGANGLRSAYRLAERNQRPGMQSRVVLCTDGDFNVGESSEDRLRMLIREQAHGGVFLNVFGVGTGNYQDKTAKALAANGNGVYAYLDSSAEAERIITGMLGHFITVAKDAKVQLYFNPAKVVAWRQIGYEYRQLRRSDFNNDRVDSGDIGAGHSVTALYEIIPARGAADANPFIAGQRANTEGEDGALLQVRLRCKLPDGRTSRLSETMVTEALTEPDADFRFACGVAGFGMLLRHSPSTGRLDWSQIATWAGDERDEHDERRREFQNLVAAARRLDRRR